MYFVNRKVKKNAKFFASPAPNDEFELNHERKLRRVKKRCALERASSKVCARREKEGKTEKNRKVQRDLLDSYSRIV